MKSSRTRSSRRRPLRRNPLSTKQKLAGIGGILVVGGVAAYTLMRSGASATQTGPEVDPRVAKAAECAMLQAQLTQLRSQAAPDRATMLLLEGQIAACIAQARELGAPVDTAASTLSVGDALFAQIDGWFNDYKLTSEHDPLKRNNTRQSILTAGSAMAASYAEAVTQASTPQAGKLVAQSVVRALDAAVTRQLCYLGNERGCSTFGSNEDQPDAKAAQEQSRVIDPLLQVYAQIVAKFGGPTRPLSDIVAQQYLATILRPCVFMKQFIDGQFEHYKTTEWSDSLKRNNTRQYILASSRNLAGCLQGVFAQAQSFNYMPIMRQVSGIALAALNSSIDRWQCYFSNGPGCGTFAVNEDQPDAKAAQERAGSVAGFLALYDQIARVLLTRGDANAFAPLIAAKLRVCSGINNYIAVQWNNYVRTEWSDALKRNNTRMWILATSRDLTACLEDTLATALSAGATPTASTKTGLRGLGGYVSSRPALGAATAPPPSQYIQLLTPVNAAALAPSVLMTPTNARPVVDVAALVRPIAALTAAVIDAAIQRKLCFLYNGYGCGTFAVNEDQPDVKAAQEQSNTIGPLVALYKRMVTMVGDADVPLVRAFLREINGAKEFIDLQYADLKRTSYIDPVKRINIRNTMIRAGRHMVKALQDAKPTTAEGRALLRSAAQAALTKSREREECYRTGAPGCDQTWGTFTEGSGAAKAAEERAAILDPLAAILVDRSANGLGSLGDESGMSTAAWIGLGLVGGAIVYSALQKPVRKNSRRRTSRRATYASV